LPIGRLGFDIIDIDECLNLSFIETGEFPETIITEMYEGGLYEVENGSYVNLDLNSFHLISEPPASQMIVTLTANQGEILCEPVEGFIGEVDPFEYQICNVQHECITAKVFTTVTVATNTTNPYSKDDIRLFPTAAKDHITVEYVNIAAKGKAQIAITDMNGGIVFQANDTPISGDAIHRFDTSTLAQGVYFLSTMIEGEWIAKKFIKI